MWPVPDNSRQIAIHYPASRNISDESKLPRAHGISNEITAEVCQEHRMQALCHREAGQAPELSVYAEAWVLARLLLQRARLML